MVGNFQNANGITFGGATLIEVKAVNDVSILPV